MIIGYLDPWGRSPKQHLNTRAFSQKVDEGSGLNSSYSNVCLAAIVGCQICDVKCWCC